MEKRVLVMDETGYLLSGGSKELRVNVTLRTREDYSSNVELLLKRMSNSLWNSETKAWKGSTRPWHIEVKVVAPMKLQPGFNRSGIRVVFDTQPKGDIVPNPGQYVQDDDQGVYPWN